MPDDFTIVSDAAEKVIRDLIAAKVPSMFQHQIPADVPHRTAQEIAQAVVAALTDAGRLAPPNT